MEMGGMFVTVIQKNKMECTIRKFLNFQNQMGVPLILGVCFYNYIEWMQPNGDGTSRFKPGLSTRLTATLFGLIFFLNKIYNETA